MAKKQFKAESKRLMDLMINSIYTHKEIFLREIISNASDAEDKLAYRALTDDSVEVKRKDLKITIVPDKEKRTRRTSWSPTWAPSPRAAPSSSSRSWSGTTRRPPRWM